MATHRRSSRLTAKAAEPVPTVADVMERIDTLTGKYYQTIDEELAKVMKYYKDDGDKIVSFFFDDWEFDVHDFKHVYLMRRIFEKCGLDNTTIVDFLNTIDNKDVLLNLCVVRYMRGTNVHYRIRTGIHA